MIITKEGLVIPETLRVVCPHCGGKIVPSPDYVRAMEPQYLYDCRTCCRGFDVLPDGSWHAMYDANSTRYTAKEVAEAQKDAVKGYHY